MWEDGKGDERKGRKMVIEYTTMTHQIHGKILPLGACTNILFSMVEALLVILSLWGRYLKVFDIIVYLCEGHIDIFILCKQVYVPRPHPAFPYCKQGKGGQDLGMMHARYCHTRPHATVYTLESCSV